MTNSRNEILEAAQEIISPEALKAASDNWARNNNEIISPRILEAEIAAKNLQEEMQGKKLSLETLKRDLGKECEVAAQLTEPVAFFNGV